MVAVKERDGTPIAQQVQRALRAALRKAEPQITNEMIEALRAAFQTMPTDPEQRAARERRRTTITQQESASGEDREEQEAHITMPGFPPA